jgi:hypothetical protein
MKKAQTPLTAFGRWAVDRARRVLRVSIYAGVVALVIAVVGLRSVHGSVGEAAFSVGRQLAGFEDLTGGSHRVRLNGEPVNLASAVVDAPLSKLLDRFEASCSARSVLPPEFEEPARAAQEAGASEVDPETGVLRRESGDEGMVACIVRDGSPPRTLSARLARFTETLDLGDVGLLRYAYAKRTKDGRTHVVTAWTDGPFRLSALLGGGSADAPGSDLPGGGRPIESVRLLSASIEGVPHSVRIYQSSATAQAVLGAMQKELSGSGWEPLPIDDAVPEGRAFSRAGVDLLVFAYADEAGSVVSMVTSSFDTPHE